MSTSIALAQTERNIDRFRECYEAIKENMGSVLVGQEQVVRLLSVGVMSGGHMLLIGVPGLAKTMMAKMLARILGWEFRRIQFTPDLMPADITGTEILQSDESGARRELVFRKGPVFANLILADEINRTPPKTQAALLEAMQEHSVTVGGKTYSFDPPFVVIATQNPIEQEGTYPLPEAQLDRFFLSIHVDYPSPEDEVKIARRPAKVDTADIKTVASRDDFKNFMDIVDQMPVTDRVLEYAVSISAGSCPGDPSADEFIQKYVSWGAGPRATQHLVTAAKTVALMDGRPSPEIEDIQKMAVAVLRHRIIPSYTALGDGIDAAAIVLHLLETRK